MVKMKRDSIKLDKGVFVISLDFELIWGTVDLFGPEGFRRACEIERERVIDELLNLFVEFEFPATWCILGHLFLDKCEATNGQKHPEIVRPQHAWHSADWFQHDPCESEHERSVFVGRSLVEKIKNCPVSQEIGSHSFSHVVFADEGCSCETAETEMKECVRLANEMNVKLESFAFPRNEVGHLDVLREKGFTCYRGVEPNWYENPKVPEKARRILRLIDVLRAAKPPVVLPEKTENGLWNIPGSAIYFPMHGVRRHIPLSLRVKRAVKGLNAAVREKKVFHLWFHPTNMADEIDAMFDGLRQIMEHAAGLRDKGELEFLTMGQLVRKVE
jgi:peptidoglycan/xylan/chitin deacetylase (PgdA/CDA1 family)